MCKYFSSIKLDSYQKLALYCHTVCRQIIVFNTQNGLLLAKEKITGKYCLGFCDCAIYACKMSGDESQLMNSFTGLQ